jgi:nuclear pore complex protein Nup205
MAEVFVSTGKATVDEVMYSFNEQFIQEATQLSDDFNIDEMLAVKLLFRGTNESEHLDRTPLQSARFLFHSRRRNLLNSLRLILCYLVGGGVEDAEREELMKVLEYLTTSSSGTPSFADRCISAMSTVREAVQQLKGKEKNAHTLRMSMDPAVREDLELQLKFLRDQHEILSSIVFYLVKSKKVGIAEFRRLLGVFAGFESYDVFTVHHILPVFTLASHLCGPESPLTFEEIIQLHKELLKDYKESIWSLRYCQGSMLIWWLGEFNGLCNDPLPGYAPFKDSVGYVPDIFEPARTALNDGGLEFIMALTADVGGEPCLNASKEDLHRFLQTRVPPLENLSTLLLWFKDLLIGELELFIDNFIANMAKLLFEIKTTEEEDIMMDKRTFDYELERFFFIIYHINFGRQDAGKAFWSDPESHLHGFIQWAARSHSPFMIATFSYMMTAISFGKECAAAAHRFLVDEPMPGANRNHRRGESLTWSYIFKQLRLYIQTLQNRQQALVPGQSYRPLPPLSEPSEPSPELGMELDSLLRLSSRIVTDCPEARDWIKTHHGFNFVTSLFDLLNLQASIQLWDSIFSTISAFLTSKEDGDRDKIWSLLDNWALGTPTPSPSFQIGTVTTVIKPFAQGGSENLDMIISTVHPAEAFTRLLTRLVEPPESVKPLRDSLPFPENLGSSNRISGMEPYVDFVLGTIFSNTSIKNLPQDLPPRLDREETVSEKLSRVQYRRFRPILQLSCLQFMYTCLVGFNDNLLDMAHKGISVDGGIRSSSLLTYAKLHPFGRVMEHILTERCLDTLFEILKLGTDDIISNPEAPAAVVDSVLYAIMIIDLGIQLQPTYFRVVRPYVKQDEGVRRTHVTGNGFEKLEKAFHYNLESVVCLGRAVGSAQRPIVLAAIRLLEKLNVSPDLVASTETCFGRRVPVNRVLGVVEQSVESRAIVFNFINQWDIPEENQGFETQFPLKMPILQFLDNTLTAQPDEYTLAHMILGFGYDLKGGVELSLSSGGVGSGVSLLHKILSVATDVEDCLDGVYSVPHCELKNACYSVLSRLWNSPSTSSEILYILRANKFLFQGFLAETTLNASTLWGGVPLQASLEFFELGASAFCNFLKRRATLFEYTALEIRQLNIQGASSVVQSYLSTLLGTTFLPDRGLVANVHILDLLDFLEFSFPERVRQIQVEWLKDSNLLAFQEENESKVPLFDLTAVAEFLQIKKNGLIKSGALNSDFEPMVETETNSILSHLFCENQLRLSRNARFECLKAWATLVIMMLEDCDMERMSKTAFILQVLQGILPKLEHSGMDDIDTAEVFSSLSQSLVSHLNFDTISFDKGRGDLAIDRLYQLFRISLRCIQSPSATSKLREDFYSVALQYLNGMAQINGQNCDALRHNIQTVKASGDRLLEVICNDAYAGDGTCKVVSLLLLEALTAIASEEGTTYVVDTLVRRNFLVVLVDSMKSIASDLRNTGTESKDSI